MENLKLIKTVNWLDEITGIKNSGKRFGIPELPPVNLRIDIDTKGDVVYTKLPDDFHLQHLNKK